MHWFPRPSHWHKAQSRPIIAIAWSQFSGGRMAKKIGSPLADPFYFDQEVLADGSTKLHALLARTELMGESLDRYMNFVLYGGGIPVIVPIQNRTDFTDSILDRCDGVLLSGGDDLAPSFFKEKPISDSCIGNLTRTWSETALIRGAVERKLPIFGICRGFQQLCVTFGGTLIQDIPSQVTSEQIHYQPNGDCYHRVKKLGGSTFANCFPELEFSTNSWHHQAADRIGEGTVVGIASDGIIEAAEWAKYHAMGVQWHPERMVNNRESINMAQFFISMCLKK